MSIDELVDVVDEQDSVLGPVPRSIIRSENLLHRTVAVLCRNGRAQVIFHRRSHTKDVYPGYHDALVGGVVRAGESYDAAAGREIAEEFGIVGVTPAFLFSHRYLGPVKNCWIAAYEVGWDGPVNPQGSEIAWWGWISQDELLQSLEGWDLMPDHLEVLQRYRSMKTEE